MKKQGRRQSVPIPVKGSLGWKNSLDFEDTQGLTASKFKGTIVAGSGMYMYVC